MSRRSRSLSLGSCLALAGCFNPSGQTTAASGDATTSASTGVTTSSASTEGTTGSATTPQTVTAGGPTTGGACGTCAPPTPYCVPSGDCVSCLDLPDHGMSCGAMDLDKPYCDLVGDVGSGLCVACLSAVECDSNVPICHPELKECVGCVTGQDCPPSLECDRDTHSCVGCLQNTDCPDPENAPICDGGVCRACREHSECPATACELDAGGCFPDTLDTHHWYVDAATDPCNDSQCIDGAPCCTIVEAFANLSAAPELYHVVHVEPGVYTAQLVLNATQKRVAVLGQDDVELNINAPGGPLVLVGDAMSMQPIDSKLFLSRLKITGEGSVGVSCLDATYAALDEIEMHDILGGAVFAGKCRTRVRRSSFIRPLSGAWVASGGLLEIQNSIITGMTQQSALRVTGDGELDLLYSTIALQGDVAYGLLYCTGGTVAIRNSVLFANNLADNIDCTATVTASYSATTDLDLPALGPGMVNAAIELVDDPFIDWEQSDLHLLGDGSYLKDLALWTAGDPLTDIQGLMRPAVDGAMDIAGADLPGEP